MYLMNESQMYLDKSSKKLCIPASMIFMKEFEYNLYKIQTFCIKENHCVDRKEEICN